MTRKTRALMIGIAVVPSIGMVLFAAATFGLLTGALASGCYNRAVIDKPLSCSEDPWQQGCEAPVWDRKADAGR